LLLLHLDWIAAEMEKCSPPPAGRISEHAPLIELLKTDAAKLNLVIGAGGKTIKSIIESTGVESVDVSDDGSVSYPIPSLSTEFLHNCIWLVTFKSVVAEFPLQSDIHVYEVCILLYFVG
jgi:hypothetical protein